MKEPETESYCDKHSGVCVQITNLRYLIIAGLSITLVIVLTLFGWSQSEHKDIKREHTTRYTRTEEALHRQEAIQTDITWIKKNIQDLDSKINNRTDQIQKSIDSLYDKLKK